MWSMPGAAGPTLIPATHHHMPSSSRVMLLLGSLWGGLAGLWSVSGLWGGGIYQEGGWSTCGEVRQRRGFLHRLPAALWVPKEAGSQLCFGQQRVGLCVLPTSNSVSRSVRLSGLSSVLPSLLAPPLVSSSLTYWQDEVPRLRQEPAARGLPPARQGEGGGSLLPGLVVLRASGQTPPPPCCPGCDSGLQTLPTHGERAPHACIGVPGLLVVRGQWPGWAGQTWPSYHPLWAVRKLLSWGQPHPILVQGAGTVWVCVLVHVCHVSVPFSAVSCASGPLVHPSSAIPTLGEGLLRGAGALCLSLGRWVR